VELFNLRISANAGRSNISIFSIQLHYFSPRWQFGIFVGMIIELSECPELLYPFRLQNSIFQSTLIMISFRKFLLAASCLFSSSLISIIAAQAPNVIFIITDDQGYGDISAHGNPVIKTPAIDKLYGESVRLTNYHVTPTCAPTRGALMSGHYTNRAGPWHTIMGRSMLYQGEATLGEVFAEAGYRTGMFGKWHLGDNYPYRPEDRGFHEVVRHGGGGVGQTPDYWDNAYFDGSYFHNGKVQKYKGYCTDVWFDTAKDFIEDSVKRDKPFFAYLCTNAPHGPFHVADKYWKPYQAKGLTDQEAVFYGMIANVDENVAKMREFLDKKGLTENTIFIFTTDNGTASGENIFNSGMRGKKGSQYEGGHRVPLFMHWPKGGLDKGRDIPQLSAHIDMLPTFVDLCGLKVPMDYALDGRSLAPLIFQTPTPWPDRTIITDSQRVLDPIKWKTSSVMTQRWRLIDGKELYDMDADPGQETDVAAKYPKVFEKLRADYDAWWESLQPAFKKFSTITLGHPSENPSQLTAHDWLTQENVPWHQSAIRDGKLGFGHSGKWAVNISKAGSYKVTLRRWPRETGLDLDAPLAPGKPVDGLRAYRETPGSSLHFKTASVKIGDQTAEKKVTGGEGTTFEMKLPQGETFIEASFTTTDGEQVGAYYVVVERVG
jgi:arylsulfatase A-like enzyme